MWQVFVKELIELLRDKKTLFFIIALPMVIFPVLFGVMGYLGAKSAIEEHDKEIRYVVINSDAAPKFAEKLFYHSDFKKIDLILDTDESRKEAIQNDKVDIVIIVDANYQEQRTNKTASTWQLYYSGSSLLGGTRLKVDKAFKAFADQLQKGEFTTMGLSDVEFEVFKTPIQLEEIDTADERESFGEKLGGLIPYILIPLCLTGAMYPAIDLGAGEKERGTIETLLLTPVSRLSLVLGKFFCIGTTAIMTALITIFSLVFWSFLIGQVFNVAVVSEILSAVSWGDYALMVLLLVPICAIFSSTLLAISIYAKSYKEAQNYMGPMSIFVIFPVLVVMTPGINLTFNWALVPISNVALAIKELLKGTIDYSLLIPIFGSTGLFAFASLTFCVYWFNKESVLFR